MNILITGAKGFIGKNLISQLNNEKNNLFSDLTIYEYDIDTDEKLLDLYTKDCDFVYHLAGINRTENPDDFMIGNVYFLKSLLDFLTKNKNKAPVLMTSSIQAVLDNPYGKSKKAAEDLLFKYSKYNNSKIYIYRLPNVFGKWSMPNYNSVVATFCNNIANDLPIVLNNPDTNINLAYIDDVVNEFIGAITGKAHSENEFCFIPTLHKVKLCEISELLYSFKKSRKTLYLPNLDNAFERALYSTYISYLPIDKMTYPLEMHCDSRGSFTEIIRTLNAGQFSINLSKPHAVKGNHWHRIKTEKFVIVSGRALIRLRKISENEVILYNLTGDKPEVIDIPPGYVHSIENTGDTDMTAFMWCSECYDENNPDTYFEEVLALKKFT